MLTRMTMILTVLWTACSTPAPQKKDWLTYFEQSQGLETPRYDATMEYLHRLEKASPWIHVSTFGISPLGRKNPLVIVDKSGAFNVKAARDHGKNVILIQAGIHAGEIDGKDAGMMLIRDLAVLQQHDDWLDNTVILFMPFFNVDGHEKFGPHHRINQNGPKEMGWRVTSQNLNLNRDYMKADAPEMRDWLRVFSEWRPDIVIDCHVTDGADYRHVVTYSIDETYNVVKPVQDWTNKIYMPALKEGMAASGFPMVPYVYPVDDLDITKGIIGGVSTPRFSTGYAALQNRIGFLIETHMYKAYKSRVEGTYQVLSHTLEIVAKEKGSLAKATAEGDRLTSAIAGQELPLLFERDTAINVDLQGYNFRLEKSPISADTYVKWEPVPIDYKIPFFDDVRTTYSARVPYAFVIPQQWTSVLAVMQSHGIQMERLGKDRKLSVTSYQFQNPKWAAAPFEGRIGLTVDAVPTTENRPFRAGDYVVRTDQATARVIMNLLEPRAPDSFIQWGFFNAIFEQKEYGEPYKLELLAADMIEKDTILARQFDNLLKWDKAFAANGYGRLNWFYQHSPWWDQEVNRYPIGKVMDKKDLD